MGDRIVRVDGHPLRGLENMEAAAVLRNSGNPVKLVLGRRRRRNTSPPGGGREGGRMERGGGEGRMERGGEERRREERVEGKSVSAFTNLCFFSQLQHLQSQNHLRPSHMSSHMTELVSMATAHQHRRMLRGIVT